MAGVMKLQSEAARCGATAVQNALLAVEVVRSEDEIAALAATSAWDGTGARGILAALRKVAAAEGREPPAVVEEGREDVAALKLEAALRWGRPIIALVGDADDPWNHWVAVIGLLGGRVSIADPAQGTVQMGLPALLGWMRGPAGKRKPFYGVVV